MTETKIYRIPKKTLQFSSIDCRLWGAQLTGCLSVDGPLWYNYRSTNTQWIQVCYSIAIICHNKDKQIIVKHPELGEYIGIELVDYPKLSNPVEQKKGTNSFSQPII